MKFVRIEMLFLVWAIPVLLLVYLHGSGRRKKILAGFASDKGLKKIVPDPGKKRRLVKMTLSSLALLFMSVAVAGPQYGYHWQDVERKGIDIIIALDCSKSMLAEDIRPTRLDRAKREIYDLLQLLEGDRIGLVAFAGTAFLQCPLTLDYESFHLFLSHLTPDFLPVGGSDIPAAIRTAIAGFDIRAASEKAVILITDGENTGSEDPVKAAEEADKAKVKLFTIGVGSTEGVPVPDGKGGFRKDKSGAIVYSKLDEEMLKKIAVLSGGAYVRSVAGDMDLDLIYTKEIRGKMEKSTLESSRKQVWADRYQWMLFPAAILFSIMMLLPSRKNSGIVTLIFIVLLFSMDVRAADVKNGYDAYLKKDYEKALNLFIEDQLEHPENKELSYNIGNAYYRLGEFDSAEKSFREALKTDDTSLKKKAWYNLGNTMFKKKRYEDAIKNYENALKIDPEDKDAKENIAFVRKVMEELKKKKEEEKQKDQEKDGKKEGEEKKDSESKSGNASDEKPDEQQQVNSGDQKKEEENPAGMEPKTAPDKKEEKDQQASAEKAQANDENKNPDDREKKKNGNAERMLNRLKDQPGRALIPMYRKRVVEKDW